jgi:hypothetical protein
VANPPEVAILHSIFRSFQGLARVLIGKGISPQAKHQRATKGDFKMSAKSQLTHTLIAIVAALATSTLAVGAAVGPAQAVANPTQVTFNA